MLHCDQAGLEALAAEYGTPLYVYSSEQITHRYQIFARAFADRPHTVCYAVKANSSLAILRLLAEQGAGFDIVSGGELERIRKASKSALRKVVFSGVGKQVWEIDTALQANILLFNVESEAELHLLASRAEALGKVARFALRVNPDVFAETHPYISTGLSEHKFGIDINAARAIYRRAKKSRWLDAAGVSVHIGSQIRKVEPFAAALARVTALIAELRKDGHDIRYIDAGGGLGVEYGPEVSSASAAASDPERQVKQYAAAVFKGLGGETAHLILEPGRFIVAPAGGLLTRVLYVKKTAARNQSKSSSKKSSRKSSKTFVITDAAMNDLIRPALYHAHHEILAVKQPAKSARPDLSVDVVGPVCESGDFFARDRALPAVKPGDLVLLLDAGAYGMSQTSNYNSRPRPAEVLVNAAAASLIRRRETIRDLLAPELLP